MSHKEVVHLVQIEAVQILRREDNVSAEATLNHSIWQTPCCVFQYVLEINMSTKTSKYIYINNALGFVLIVLDYKTILSFFNWTKKKCKNKILKIDRKAIIFQVF